MKKYIFLAIITALLYSCSNEDSVNSAPSVPTLIFPTNNKLCISNAITFQWEKSVDSDNDLFVYKIEISKTKDFSAIVKTIEGAATSQSFVLEKGTAYYWRVKTRDVKDMSSEYSAVYGFYTSGVGVTNYLPFSPDLVSPQLNSVLTTTKATLQWTASDVDTGDKLTYDVYFGTVNPPVDKVGSNIATLSLDVDILASKEYFWKVVVKDDKGGETTGQTWLFRTK